MRAQLGVPGLRGRGRARTEALAGLAAAGCSGLNVTIPHKRAVMEHCSSVSEAATAIGAANTLIPDGAGGFRADNTDAEGFQRALDEAVPDDVAAGWCS